MQSVTRERSLAPVGVGAVVLWVLGVVVIGGGHVGFPGGVPEEGSAEVAGFYAANADAITAGSWAFLVGSLLFTWFVARLGQVVGGGGSGSALATAAGVATGALALGVPAAGLVTALGAAHLDAPAVQALDAVGAVFFVGTEMAAALMLVALVTAARATGAFGRSWRVASLALALWLVIAPIGWVGLIVGLPVWTVVTALLTLRRPAPAVRSGERAEAIVSTP